MPPSVSVIVTSHNYARFLPAALDSVRAQSVPPRDVVVVDDGSTDGSAGLVQDRYREVTLVAKANGGQASAFNAGLGACRGDVVCLLDADDWWAAGKVAAVTQAFHRHPDAAMLRHDLLYAAPGTSRDATRVLHLRDRVGPPVTASRSLVERRHGPTSALAFPRWVLQELLPMPEPSFRISADAYLYTLAPTLGPVLDLAAPLAHYRLHGGNGYMGDGPRTVERALRTEAALVRVLTDRGCEPVVPHHVYRAARRHGSAAQELLRGRGRLRQAGDALRGSGSRPRRLAHALEAACGRRIPAQAGRA